MVFYIDKVQCVVLKCDQTSSSSFSSYTEMNHKGSSVWNFFNHYSLVPVYSLIRWVTADCMIYSATLRYKLSVNFFPPNTININATFTYITGQGSGGMLERAKLSN